jgi:hypothetical protein
MAVKIKTPPTQKTELGAGLSLVSRVTPLYFFLFVDGKDPGME